MLLGLDGCKGGWVVAAARSDDLASMSLHLVSNVFEALALGGAGAIVAIDMPIGLLDVYQPGGRECDRLTRALLGPSGSSVFPTPVRAAIMAATYHEACIASRGSAPGAGALSRQSFGLAPKIREIDALLRGAPELRERVVETHPEAVFASLAGGPLPSKKQEDGRTCRIRILAEHGFTDPTSIAPEGRRSCYQTDDLIDAAACLIVARDVARGVSVSIPESPPLDCFGIPMRILTPRSA